MVRLAADLEALAERVGVPSARVVDLRARLARRRDRPLRLVLGIPATVDLFLARWLGPSLGRAALSAGVMPLIVGAAPETIGALNGGWPGTRHALPVDGDLVVVRSEGRPRADVLAGLQALAPFDQAVLITRLGQPFNPDDRALASCLKELAAHAEVLVMGLGEPEDLAEFPRVQAYAAGRLAAAGLAPEQQGAAAVWCPGLELSEGALARPEDLLNPPPAAIEAGRIATFCHTMAAVLEEIEDAAAARDAQPLDQDEQAQAIREFSARLDALWRKLAAMVQSGEIRDDPAVHDFLIDTVDAWSTGEGPAALWLRGLERRQPGLAPALASELRNHLHLLKLRVDSRPSVTSLLPRSVDLPPARPAGIAIGAGVVGFVAAWLILQIVFSSWLAAMLANIAALGVGLLIFHRLLHDGPLVRRGPGSVGRALIGVEPLNQHLQAWFGSRIRAAPESVAATCARLRAQLGQPRLASAS